MEEKIAGVVPKTITLDATGIAEKCGTSKAANIVLVGLVGKTLGMPLDSLVEAIRGLVPEKAIDVNIRALNEGWNYMDKVSIDIGME